MRFGGLVDAETDLRAVQPRRPERNRALPVGRSTFPGNSDRAGLGGAPRGTGVHARERALAGGQPGPR